MRLLVDTDVFCKLGVANLFDDAVSALGFQRSDCGRLPALPYMLRRGPIPKLYGAAPCAALIPTAESIASFPTPDASWLDRLAKCQDVDPGEAQLFALAAQKSLIALSGDKRALRALKDADGLPAALSGRIVVFEALLLLLCEHFDAATLRNRLVPLVDKDIMVRICFSDDSADPRDGLRSYYSKLSDEVAPLMLWDPQQGVI